MSTNTGKRKEAQILGLYPRSDRTHENHPDPRRGVGNISTTPQRLEDAENPGSETSTTSVAVKAGYYTREDIDIMNAVLHTPPSGTSPAPTAGHDRRFITLVGPPPAPSKDTSETSTTTQSTRPPPQQLSQPRLQPTASQQPQPSTSSPTLPPSQKQPPPATWQPSATRDGEEAQISTTQSVVTSISSLTPSPSQRPEKQPDSVATPISPPSELSRDAEAGIVIGSIAVGQQHLYQPEQEPCAAAGHFPTVSAGPILGATGVVGHAAVATRGTRGGHDGEAATAAARATVVDGRPELELVQPFAMRSTTTGATVFFFQREQHP
ncbi:hypothetical protein CCM_07392 [Cordyceps militaris CM01]|uniref:Uncharacterized protein n=1 Tax=Cordyceps militaris (strain CM01) TaxID=983644 RepID=G3JPN9_CORMM|nr:uncharacterized protein CCM_07392 [Cordyceps militaris CM01]EGX89140.1 hypothetical protein CCM_07392 [Cordyceps militaris CM01]